MTTDILDARQTTGRAPLESLCAYLEHLLVQEPVEQEAPPQTRSPDGAAPAGEVTAIDETTMKEEDLQEAVGLLTQLEVRPKTPSQIMLPASPLRLGASQGSELTNMIILAAAVEVTMTEEGPSGSYGATDGVILAVKSPGPHGGVAREGLGGAPDRPMAIGSPPEMVPCVCRRSRGRRWGRRRCCGRRRRPSSWRGNADTVRHPVPSRILDAQSASAFIGTPCHITCCPL